MSSIAVPSRTEAPRPAAAAGGSADRRPDLGASRERLLRLVAGAGLLTALLVTFTPFEATSAAGVEATGNLVNQLGYSGLAAVALVGHLTVTPRRAALSLLSPAWLAMAGWLAIAALHAIDPAASIRAAFFTIAAMLAVTGALCLPASERDFRLGLGVAAFVVVALSYGGLVVMPTAAIHQAVGAEAHQAGLWRGIYSHKNVAGAVFGALFFVGLYLMRCRSRLTGFVIAGACALFVLKTGSKTALGLLPVVAVLVVVPGLMGLRAIAVAIIVAMLALTALATLGSVMVPALRDLLHAVAPGTTFTGRTEIWDFGLRALEGRGWTGFGLESFWRTPVVLSGESYMDYAWDPRGATNAHNGFLDVAIALGWPGLAVATLTLVALPLRDYLRSGTNLQSRRLADMFLMVLCYLLLNSFLESFLFARANPVWIMLFLSVAGLRMLARHRPAAGA